MWALSPAPGFMSEETSTLCGSFEGTLYLVFPSELQTRNLCPNINSKQFKSQVTPFFRCIDSPAIPFASSSDFVIMFILPVVSARLLYCSVFFFSGCQATWKPKCVQTSSVSVGEEFR